MLVFIYLRMTARSRRGEATEAGPHIKRRGSAGCKGTMPLPLLRRVFPGPNKPRKVCVGLFLIAVPHPMPAGDFGVSRRRRVPLQRPSAAGRAGLGCILEVPLGTLALSPCSEASVPTSLLLQ